jgi:1,4-alpha-glucan branching enzyme
MMPERQKTKGDPMARAKMNMQKVTFSLLAPHAQSVFLAGTFNSWNAETSALRRQKSGLWKIAVSLEPGRHEYRFVVDGQWTDDPLCDRRVTNPFGAENCVREVGAE